MMSIQKNSDCCDEIPFLGGLKKAEVLRRFPRRSEYWVVLQLSGGKTWESLVSVDVKKAFGDVTPRTRSETMRKLGMHATMTEAMFRERLGGRYDVCFQ